MADTPDKEKKEHIPINSETEQAAKELKEKSRLEELSRETAESLKVFRGGNKDAEMPGGPSPISSINKVGESLKSKPVADNPIKVQVQPQPSPTLPQLVQKSALNKAADKLSTPPNLPGASNGVFLLGGTLAIVALWSNVINPLIDIGWNGFASKKRVTMPASGIISLVLFILLITFISTLSPEFANVSFMFILGLWAVYLIMNPTVVQNVAGYVSQGNRTQAPSSDSASGAGNPHQGQH